MKKWLICLVVCLAAFSLAGCVQSINSDCCEQTGNNVNECCEQKSPANDYPGVIPDCCGE